MCRGVRYLLLCPCHAWLVEQGHHTIWRNLSHLPVICTGCHTRLGVPHPVVRVLSTAVVCGYMNITSWVPSFPSSQEQIHANPTLALVEWAPRWTTVVRVGPKPCVRLDFNLRLGVGMLSAPEQDRLSVVGDTTPGQGASMLETRSHAPSSLVLLSAALESFLGQLDE